MYHAIYCIVTPVSQHGLYHSKHIYHSYHPYCSKTKTKHLSYRKTSNISRTLVGNKIVDHSDVVGAAPTTFSFST